jgi:hypothetical protein
LYRTGAKYSIVSDAPKDDAMSARQFSIRPRRSNARSASAKLNRSQLNQVLKAIETERGNLSRAVSLLGCLTIAMEYGEMSHKGPYYPDIVQMAQKMVSKSINALDPINLPSPSRDKVREDFFAPDGVTPPLVLHEVALVPRPMFEMLPRQSTLRIHRRNYSRPLAMKASSRDSASANIPG